MIAEFNGFLNEQLTPVRGYMVRLFGRGGGRRASRCLWGRCGRELRPSLNSTDLNFKAGLLGHSLNRNSHTAAESHVPARHSRTPDMHPQCRPNAIKHTSTRTSSNTVNLQSTIQISINSRQNLSNFFP